MSLKISIIDKNPGKVKKVVEAADLEEVSAYAMAASWSPSTFSTDTRSVAGFTGTELLVLDIDDGCTIEQATVDFKGLKAAIITSRNHQKEKNGKICDRFRVIICLSQPITDVATYAATWLEAQRRWPYIDPACKDPARMFYPAIELVSVEMDGTPLTPTVGTPISENKKNDGVVRIEKGELWKSTLDFLLRGAPAGHRHQALVKAVGNMKEQGYDLTEIVESIERMTEAGDWTQPGLNEKDRRTIEDVYNRPHRYEFVARDEMGEAQLTESPLDLINETLDYLADKDRVKGDSTGIEGLDKMLGGGFRTGELTVLMANAKSGKNSLYHYMLYTMMQRGLKVAYASRELSPASEVLPNLISIATGNNAWKADVTEGFREMVKQMVAGWPLKFASGYGYFPPEQLVAWMRQMKEEGINHFLIDHLHYMLKGEDYESTAELIKIIKTQTKELDIHVNLIVQPRSLREGERLSLATLRGGAAIGQALDNLLILERVRGEDNISRLTLEVARHKLARLGEIYLKYDSDSTIFEEVVRELVREEDDDMPHMRRSQRQFPRVDGH